MKKFYQESIDEVFESVASSSEGLSSTEAKERLERSGKNVLKEKNKKSAFKIFLSQFNNMMTLLLILVGIVSLVYSIITKESLVESIVVFACVLVNTLMGFFQEMKAENAIEALKTFTQSKAQVKRDGAWIEIDTAELVVGDIIALESGDKIPADARILVAVNAKVDESILTGESISVDKQECVIKGDKLIQEQTNIVFSGTSLVNGRIEAVVIKTGMDTELGRIAGNLDSAKEELTPLQVKVKKVSGFITVIACILIALTLCYGLITKQSVIAVIMLCISMVLAAVPEVLPVSITATLTIGVSQMAKKKTVVKQMAAIETLGATQVICSDKTGTITTNQMTLIEVFANDKTYLNVKQDNQELQMLDNILALCNDTQPDKNNNGEFLGDPVEIALSKYLVNLGKTLEGYRNEHKRVGELPFDSTRKMMSTVNEFGDKKLMLTKGSLGDILARCVGYYKNGKVVKITKHIASKFLAKEKAMSKKAYKVLAFAYRDVTALKEVTLQEEKDLILVGITGLVDPPKDGVKEAVKKCKEAHMLPIMITGDSLTTAMAVAVEVGIAKTQAQGVEGKAIDGLTDDELRSFVKNYTVFARVTPDHKVRIVRAFQALGKVVAMTGDGVNDAPALKLAHVGIGMGKAGSDVTKNVADIILMDDSFATIVTAVEEGRRIYNNVLRTILYNLSSNFAEIFLILFGMIVGFNIISPLHILYIDIVADTLPSIALAFEKDSKDSMRRQPNGLDKKIFTPFMISSIIMSAVVEVAMSLAVFFISKDMFGYEVAQTLTLLCCVFNEFVFAYNCKELKGFSFKKGLFSNMTMNIITIALIIVQAVVFFTPIGSVFGLVPITAVQFAVIFAVNILAFIIIELLKPLMAKIFKDK
ncbi:MAG: cation-transporting P-type ATPase [Clostridia bacterium]|nr:cation-transporting P-type ATPase [Clostridia bacterium]